MAAKRTKQRRKAGTPTLRWMKIHQFRHVEPCELRFSETYNVLLGLNGTGKTTLLELISAALRFNFSKMKKEAFFIEYEIAAPEGTILARVRNEEPPPSRPGSGVDAPFAERLLTSEPAYRPSAELVVSDAAGKRLFAVKLDQSGAAFDIANKTTTDEYLRANSMYKDGLLNGIIVFVIPHDGAESASWLSPIANAWEHVRRFDEALGFLRTITGTSTGFRLYKRTDETSFAMVLTRSAIPASSLAELRRQLGKGGPAGPVVTITDEHDKLLSQIATMLGFKKVELRLSHLKTEMKGAAEVRSFGDLRFMLERDDGSVVPHTLLSYGQKRALSFLYYLAMNPATVIADELVDGLHHSWIVDAIEAIGTRQAFLASQNPLLLDYLEFDSTEKVRQSFVQCRLKKGKKGERMIWSNMSEYDADRFFDAYQVGLQHVSEILRTKGLW